MQADEVTDTPPSPIAGSPTAAIRDTLQTWWGFDTLRPLQTEAITAAVDGRDSLVVLPTGGGKSLCYQLPPLLSETTDIVVSPLVSLMKDQVDALEAIGYPAAAIHGGLSLLERRTIYDRLRAGELRLLFTAPERLFGSGLLDTLATVGVRRFAIDEAHCISQWGHDFRPEYRQLANLRERFPEASMHAFTATATPRVREDIASQLTLRNPETLVGIFDRPNLTYRVVPRTDKTRQTLEVLGRHAGEASIIYCISRRETEELAAKLTAAGLLAHPYHAGLESTQRHRTQEAFAKETIDVVVATVAFGMGIDRSNVRLVLHTALPKSLEAYQQETGRAGMCAALFISRRLQLGIADPSGQRFLRARRGADRAVHCRTAGASSPDAAVRAGCPLPPCGAFGILRPDL